MSVFQSTRLFAAALVALSLAPASVAQMNGVSREQMWWAPTQEDWAKPCLITWQRTWEDAVALSERTGKAILICVNMDGEIASEHYAGVRYRQPETAALYAPYVTVIASVYRHTPRDHDDEGNRILCPRFGSVTCGEHIAIEPGLYDKYFEGTRVAPRHISVELNKEEVYDVYYAFDTDSVFTTIKENQPTAPDQPLDDRPIYERVLSTDIRDRMAVEQAFVAGDYSVKERILETAVVSQVSQLDLLRLAIAGSDPDLRRTALRALAQNPTEASLELMAEALRMNIEDYEREALVASLVELGKTSPRARTLASVHQGLAARSGAVDVERRLAALASVDPAELARTSYALESELTQQARVAEQAPESPEEQLALAEAFVELAANPATDPAFSTLMYEDARKAAQRARDLGADDWRSLGILSLSNYYLGEIEAAQRQAVEVVDQMPAEEQGLVAISVLAIFAESRRFDILTAIRDKREWPSKWLADVNAAYSVLVNHPLGTDAQVANHFDLLQWLGARGQAANALDVGLRRFPDSWILHSRLRARVLYKHGVDELAGLEATYESMLRAPDAHPNLEWYAGYASLIAAEQHRRNGSADLAGGAYQRAIAHYEAALVNNPTGAETCDHYIALSLAGQGRLAFERADYDAAAELFLASFARCESAAASLDGLGMSPVSSTLLLIDRYKELGQVEPAQRLRAALDQLDPDMLRPPAFETTAQRPDARWRRGLRERR